MPRGAGDPLDELLQLQERMNRLFEESLAPQAGAGDASSWMPLADLYETPDSYVLEIELPGVEPEDLVVEVRRDRLRVRGKRRTPGGAGAPERFQCLERSFGSFARSFPLREPVVARRARRELSDGVLRVEAPKLKPKRPPPGR